MVVQKEHLVDLEEKFQKVRKLIDNSISDPESAPYTSKYAARQHLKSMNDLLDTLVIQNKTNNEMCNKIIGMLGAVQLQLGIIAMDTEELSLSEKHYDECLLIIEGNKYEQEIASVTLNLYNHQGILWAKRDAAKGVPYLTEAEKVYHHIKNTGIIPIDYMDLFNTHYTLDATDAMEKFEKNFTLTLFYLAQVFGPTNHIKSAVYCHQTLQRQYDSKDYDCIDWALNTATLSQFLMGHNGFKQARHHLCASLFMLDEHKRKLDSTVSDGEEYEAKVEYFRQRSADVARCWAKYGLNLLSNSKDRLMNTDDIERTASNCTDLAQMDGLEEKYDVTKADFINMEFKNIDLTAYEAEVGDQFVLTIEDAKKVFLYSQKWVIDAQEYHTINTHASDYIEITQDHSQLYDTMAFFEEDPEVQCKLYKRSSDLLEKVLVNINPTYYMRYCRQNWFRIGMLASDILEVKLEKMKEGKPYPTGSVHALQKVNMLVEKAVSNFSKFIDSYRNSSGGLPTRIPEVDEKSFLQAYFHIAAIHGRHYTADKATKVRNLEKSIANYKALCDYCKVNESAGDLVKAELEIAQMMCQLLYLKIARLTNELPPAVTPPP